MKPMAAAALLLAAMAALAPPARGRLDRADFPPGFLFGAGTSAYQVEGAYMEDNRSLSNWDVFTHTRPERIADGQNGDVAADHYHLYKEDVEMMHDLGVNSYRFSISWARILPRGRTGGVNPAGVAFYNRLIDALLQKGIEPFVTLHHFDLPCGLETQYGGWLGTGIREEFEHYADVCFKAFGNRVKFWTTLNEPNLFAKSAYILGDYPPNRCSVPFGACNAGDSRREPYIAAHNMLLSHAAAVRTYKKNYQAKQGGSIGIALAMKWYVPLTNNTEDIMAARRALSFEVDWFLDPIFFGDYPREMRKMLSLDLPEFTSEGRRLLVQNKMDFIGINHYTAIYAKDCISSPCDLKTYEGNALVIALGERDGVPIGKPTAFACCFDVPQGMELIIKYVNQRYENAPVYVTENGYAQYSDNSMEDLIADVGRKDFMEGYLISISSAARKGANVRGYFAWSLMDNFEWAFGFTIRFGLYHVDFKTQKRTPKMSAKWYRSFLKASGPVDQVKTLRLDS